MKIKSAYLICATITRVGLAILSFHKLAMLPYGPKSGDFLSGRDMSRHMRERLLVQTKS